MAASGTVDLKVGWTMTLAASATQPESQGVSVRSRATAGETITYTAGTAANQINKTAYLRLSLAGAAQTVDFSTIICTDGSVGFSNIRELIGYNLATTSTHVATIGNAASNPFAPWASAGTVTEIVQAGGRFLKEKPIGTTGFTVDSSNKNLKVDPGANTFTFDLLIAGN